MFAIAGVTVAQTVPAPLAVPDAYDIDKNVTRIVEAPGVLANDESLKGRDGRDRTDLAAQLTSNVTHGALALDPSGAFIYSPALDFVGIDSFSYVALDGVASSNEVLVTLTVAEASVSAPVANDDSYEVGQGNILNVPAPGIIENDQKVTGKEGRERLSLMAQLSTDVSFGLLALSGNGSFSYSPNAEFVGTDSFSYRVYDGLTVSNTATVIISVTAAGNAAPLANADVYATDAEIQLNVAAPGVLGNDTDGDNDPLTAVLVTGPASGTLTLNADGSFGYLPNAGFSGTDTFAYVADDGTEQSSAATVTITVNSAGNDVPVAAGDAYTTDAEIALNIAAPGVLGNDTDADNDPLTAVLVTGPASGTLTLNADGSFAYLSSGGFIGTDGFTYVAYDGIDQSSIAVVTITVNSAGNDAPVAAGDAYATETDVVLNVAAPGVLDNDTDADNDPLTAVLVTAAVSGSLTLNADGSFGYLPNAGFSGTDAFTYVADDGIEQSAPVAVTITVTETSVAAPLANGDGYETDEDMVLRVGTPGVLRNDRKVTGPEGKNRDNLTASISDSTENGIVLLNADGSFDYLPDAGFSGMDAFTYRAFDGTAFSNLAVVSIDVINNNHAPTISGSPETVVLPGGAYAFTPAASDPEGDPLVFNASGIPSWSVFDPVTGTLAGEPMESDIGIYGPVRISVTDGEFETWLSDFEISVVARTSTSITVAWTPPLTNHDGSVLEDLAGYRVYYWDGDVYPHEGSALTVDIQNIGVSTQVIELPWTGMWRIAVTAYNGAGLESRLSAIVPVLAE